MTAPAGAPARQIGSAGTASRRARRALAIGAVLVVVGGVAFAAQRQRQRPGLAAAQQAFADAHRFGNGPEAGATFIDASTWLAAEGQRCQTAHRRDDVRCTARLAASGYLAVSGFRVVDCTAPGVYEARVRTLRYLAAVARLDRQPATRPSPPALVTC